MDKLISLAFILIFGAFSVILFACAVAQLRWDYAIYCVFTFIITSLLIKEIRKEWWTRPYPQIGSLICSLYCICNTAGIERFPEYHFDMCRLGIGMYGFSFLSPNSPLPIANSLSPYRLIAHCLPKAVFWRRCEADARAVRSSASQNRWSVRQNIVNSTVGR